MDERVHLEPAERGPDRARDGCPRLAIRRRQQQAHRRATDPEGLAAEERDLVGLDAGGESVGAGSFVAHVVVPDQEAIKAAVLARRKQELLQKLASSAEAGVAIPEDQPKVEDLSALRRLPPSW